MSPKIKRENLKTVQKGMERKILGVIWREMDRVTWVRKPTR